MYQGNVNWDMGTRQARMADTQNQFGEPDQMCYLTPLGRFLICAWEMDADEQFSHPQLLGLMVQDSFILMHLKNTKAK